MHLVGDHDDSVFERHLGQAPELLGGEHPAGRVVGVAEQHEPHVGARGLPPEQVEVDGEPARSVDHRHVGDLPAARLDAPDERG